MHEADHSCPFSMQTEFGYTTSSPYAFVACADQVYLPIRGVNGYTTAFLYLCFSFMRELKQNNEAVTVTRLINKFPIFCETRIFITLCIKQVYNQPIAHIKNIKHCTHFGYYI